ncbi:MAG: response regulator [Desulfatitalea sp.]|nr:response regulator [Desulfatitalea sp.]NNK01648.1 response regulator [Desulfatitalea sp.]
MTKPMNIMVVDDEASICRNVEKILAKENHRVTRATSGSEALEKMGRERFDLVISDIVMPGMNGLAFLKSFKAKWPDTKAVMMTAYAATDTAVKAIRLGALDYLPKPFTPDELRQLIHQVVDGKLVEAQVSPAERESIHIIDLDIPFDADEVARSTGETYAKSLGPSDMPVVEVKLPESLEGFCELGNMVCDIFKKLGATCKAGTKKGECPQIKSKMKNKNRPGKAKPDQDIKTLIGIDQPFNYEDVRAVTGPEYLQYLQHDGVAQPTYEELKANVALMDQQSSNASRDPVVQEASVVEITADASLDGFCDVGAMVCDIFKKLGATCKAGVKSGACPQLKSKKKKKKKAAVEATFDPARMISIDLPFDTAELVAAAGSDYVANLHSHGVVQVPYEQLKANVACMAALPATDRPEAATAAESRVLIIDDEVAVNNNIRKILNKGDYTSEQATTKAEALEKIAAGVFDMVLLDLRIPGVKGLELLAAIRKQQPAARVIIITGYAGIDTAKEAARMGAMEYLPKPFSPAEIRDAAQRVLKLAA